MSELQTDPSEPASAWGSVEELFGKQNSYSRSQEAIDHVLQSLSFGGGAVNQTNVFLFH
jgi:hypothetical protein